MRILSIIFSIIFVMSVSAQTLLVKQTFDEGTQKAQVGNYENAIKDYQKALLLSQKEKLEDDFLARIHFNLGVCFYHLQRNDKAVEELTEAIRINRGKNQKAFYVIGMSHFAMKNWQTAETAFQSAIRLKKDDGEAWFDLALVYLKVKDFGAAEKAFQNAVKYKSIGSADAHNNLGVIFALKDDFLNAEKEFKTALIKSNGKSVEAVNNLEFCKLYQQNLNRSLLAKLEFSRKSDSIE